MKYQQRAVTFNKNTKKLFFSKINDFENFELGSARDGDAIEIKILSQYTEQKCTDYELFKSASHLYLILIMEDIVEFWMVEGCPISPTSIQINRLYTKDQWN